MKKPSRLYHATAPNNVPSIMEHGLEVSAFGEMYFCESIDDCVRIVGPRIALRVTGIEEVQIDDPEIIKTLDSSPTMMGGARKDDDGNYWWQKPVIERNDHLAIVEVNASMLHAGSLEVSTDHSEAIFPGLTSWVYWRNVPVTAIVHTTIVPLGD